MKKLIVSTVLVLSLASFGAASAQSTCVSISPTLTVGSRGAQVTALQNFLVSRNYPGGGNWMVTGYFGKATQAAVRLFQQEQNLPQTGVVDSATASAISSVSCGYSANTYGSNYNYSYPGYPGYYPYNNYYPNYPYNGTTPTITSLSQNTGTPGQSVTIYGTGFDPVNNTVSFGSQALYGIPSQNGTSLTFTIPSYFSTATYSFTGTSVQLYVTNSRGTSNSMNFTVYGGGYTGCGYYPYNTYPYSSQCGNNYAPSNPSYISAQYLSPQQGGVGTAVTVYGTGFTTTGNTVHFGSGIMSDLNSPDGRSVSFIVPSQLTGFGTQPLTLGTYGVSVTNNIGLSSNTIPFTVTSTGGNTAPVITSVSGPTSLGSGVQGTWSLTLNNSNSSYVTASVNWGDTGNGYVNMAAPQIVYAGTQAVTFTHAYNIAGTYTITFTVADASGETNTSTLTVTVGGSGSTTGTPYVSYVSPTSGSIGTQITISGTGFSLYGNTVHFGSGGQQNLPSYNGTTITYTIPSTISPCDVYSYSGYCPTYVQQVTPGTYNVSVTNGNGTSNTFSFNVTY
jgi:hypothetical protein